MTFMMAMIMMYSVSTTGIMRVITTIFSYNYRQKVNV